MKKHILLIHMIPLFLILNPAIAKSEPVIADAYAGQIVMFDGFLLNKEAMTDLRAKIEFCGKEKDLECNKMMDELKLTYEFQIKSLRIDLESEKVKSVELLAIKDKELHECKNIAIDHNNYDWLWYGLGGTALGAIVAGTTTYLVMVLK